MALAPCRLEESRTAGPQPLLAALYTLLTDFLSGNLRKQGLQARPIPPLYLPSISPISP